MVSVEECKHIERLSKLKFSEEEREAFLPEFESILGFASIISKEESNLSDRQFDFVELGELREDVSRESLSQEEVVSNAPDKKKGCFAVPKILD